MEDLAPPSIQKTQNIFFYQQKLKNFLSQSFQNSQVYIDLSEIRRQFLYWKQELPFVTPFYAIKCNPDPKIVEFLGKLGAKFDCASQGEMQLVHSLWYQSDDIIFANPVKGKSHIEYAKNHSVQKMTFDSIEEYRKIREIYPDAHPILRIAVDDSQSVCKFNTKFWAFPEQVTAFFQEIENIGGNVYGVSFHVGSGCRDPKIHKDAIEKAATTILEGKKHGFSMNILDIWGGYPSSDRYIKFSDIAYHIREIHDSLLEKYPELSEVVWIGEPGRYMVGTSHTMLTEVIGIKKEHQNSLRLYLNEWVYGGLSGLIFDYMEPQISVYQKETEIQTHTYTLFGPTCDSLDTAGSVTLPEVQVWDKVMFWHIWDYSVASATTFNGFQLSTKLYYISNESDREVTHNLSFEVL